MAAFTSKASGNWNAEGQTTWNEEGYPGKTIATDTVTIQNGHTVTLNITSFPGGGLGTCVVQVGGKLLIGVAMDDMTKSFEGLVTVNSGGELEFSDEGDIKMYLAANLAMNGILDMDSSGMDEGQHHALVFNTNTTTMTVGGTASIIVRGRSKTQETQLNGAMAAEDDSATMDDVTGWEEEDVILIGGTTDNDWDAFDVLTIDVGGISGNVVTFDSGAVYAHANNSRAVNLSCSARIERLDMTEQYPTKVTLNNGATVDMDYVRMGNCSTDIGIDAADGGGASPIENCVWHFQHASSTGVVGWLGGASGSNDLHLKNCIIHGGLRHLSVATGHVLRMILEGWFFSYGSNMGYTTASTAFIDLILRDCEFHAMRNTTYGWSVDDVFQHPTFEGGNAWSNAKPYYLRTAKDVFFKDFDFGIDPGGNLVGQADAVNGVEITACDAANLAYSNALCRMDRCRFASSDDTVIISGFASIPGQGRIISYNHRRVPGGYFEAQRGGFITTDTSDPYTGARAFTLDARDTAVPLRFRFVFTALDGDVVTVTYYAKKSGDIAGAVWQLGGLTGGLGGIATGSNLGAVITTSYAQYTLTFDNAASGIGGDIELLLEVDPSDGTNDIIRIDDIAVALA